MRDPNAEDLTFARPFMGLSHNIFRVFLTQGLAGRFGTIGACEQTVSKSRTEPAVASPPQG